MKIISLVENQTSMGMKTAHGLSFYVETGEHKLLFDVGPDHTIFENAEKKGIDLGLVDLVIISHGHWDHGGALEEFLKRNYRAQVYIQKRALEKHYSRSSGESRFIGLDWHLTNHPQVRLVEGDYQIDKELKLFLVQDRTRFHSGANDVLYGEQGLDDFLHEQNLMIFGEKNVLLMGCGHTGIVNIMERAREYKPDVCIGGFHLCVPSTGETVADSLLEGIAEALSVYGARYYTCHCTGEKAFEYLKEKMDIAYFSCGQELVFT